MKSLISLIAIRGLEALGRYYGTYTGVVISTEDPENANRLKLMIPKVSGLEAHPVWVTSCGSFAGKDYGVNIPVKVGDTVWVTFKAGDRRKPLWSHGYYGRSEKPQEFSGQIYGIKTPNKNLIILDDSKNSLKILLGEQYEITLDPHEKVLRITNGDFQWEVDSTNKLAVWNKDANLKTELDNLLTGITAITVTTAVGPSSTPVNSATFTAIKNSLDKLLR